MAKRRAALEKKKDALLYLIIKTKFFGFFFIRFCETESIFSYFVEKMLAEKITFGEAHTHTHTHGFFQSFIFSHAKHLVRYSKNRLSK